MLLFEANHPNVLKDLRRCFLHFRTPKWVIRQTSEHKRHFLMDLFFLRIISYKSALCLIDIFHPRFLMVLLSLSIFLIDIFLPIVSYGLCFLMHLFVWIFVYAHFTNNYAFPTALCMCATKKSTHFSYGRISMKNAWPTFSYGLTLLTHRFLSNVSYPHFLMDCVFLCTFFKANVPLGIFLPTFCHGLCFPKHLSHASLPMHLFLYMLSH